jgi:outer membrane protein assembly factor BamE (lipoprotein component of BamABCDE complex)
MTPISTRIVARAALLALSVCLSAAFFIAFDVHAQRAPAGGNAKADKPLYHDYKGVEIGMSQEEARKKLGDPKDKEDKEDAQDFYLVSDTETAQVFYQAKKVFAVTVSYLGAKAGAPEAKAVIGANIVPAADGNVYKLVRYPEAGYWVSYSRIAGDEPLVTVTMQRLH